MIFLSFIPVRSLEKLCLVRVAGSWKIFAGLFLVVLFIDVCLMADHFGASVAFLTYTCYIPAGLPVRSRPA